MEGHGVGPVQKDGSRRPIVGEIAMNYSAASCMIDKLMLFGGPAQSSFQCTCRGIQANLGVTRVDANSDRYLDRQVGPK